MLIPMIFGGIAIIASIVAAIIAYKASKKDGITVEIKNVDDDTLNLMTVMKNSMDI